MNSFKSNIQNEVRGTKLDVSSGQCSAYNYKQQTINNKQQIKLFEQLAKTDLTQDSNIWKKFKSLTKR